MLGKGKQSVVSIVSLFIDYIDVVFLHCQYWYIYTVSLTSQLHQQTPCDWSVYRAFSLDVMATILVFQNNEMAAILVCQELMQELSCLKGTHSLFFMTCYHFHWPILCRVTCDKVFDMLQIPWDNKVTVIRQDCASQVQSTGLSSIFLRVQPFKGFRTFCFLFGKVQKATATS